MRLFKALIKISLTTETKVYVLVRLDFVSGSFKCHDLLCDKSMRHDNCNEGSLILQ